MKENEIYLIDQYGMIKAIKRKVKPASRPRGGAEAVFIPISKKAGFKGFVTKKETRFAMRRQKKAAKYGIGPKVLSDEIFEVLMPVGGTYLSSTKEWLTLRRAPNYKKKHRRLYAYKTEVVPKLFNPNSNIYRGKHKEKHLELIALMRKHDFSIEDIHLSNVGIIRNKMVLLDFGNLSS